MRLIIVSGLSGSGKSVALHVLEDLGFYCIDNLPVNMLPALAEEMASSEHAQLAIGIDARNINQDLSAFPGILSTLKSRNINSEIIFLEASNSTLLKRFSETRRKHPLSSREVPLSEAIEHERSLLAPIASRSDLHIDTTSTNVHQLRDLLTDRISDAGEQQLSILFESFGFKHGLPVDADYVFDVRCIPNPHWVPELRSLTGLDQQVIDYLDSHDTVNDMFRDIREFLSKWLPHFRADNRNYMTIAVGCTGGQHRSVYLVEKLARLFRNQQQHILVRHRELL